MRRPSPARRTTTLSHGCAAALSGPLPAEGTLRARAGETSALSASAATRLGQMPDELANHPRYKILRLLAEGGMGAVYLAEHRVLSSMVAIKTIKADRAQDPRSIDRFLQEAKTAAQLDHVNIARAHDAEQLGNVVILAMEYVPGKTLAQIVGKRGPLPVDHACHYIRQVAAGLDHAFHRGVVHRDIKPQNLLVMAPQGTVKILDFGLGRLVDEQREHSRLTTDDDVLGTPHYISPEQIRDSRTADIRSDIYSLGCTMYYLLAGDPPFSSSNPVDLLARHEHEPAPSIGSLRHDVPRDVVLLIDRMLAKDPSHRPQAPNQIVPEELARYSRATAGDHASRTSGRGE